MNPFTVKSIIDGAMTPEKITSLHKSKMMANGFNITVWPETKDRK